MITEVFFMKALIRKYLMRLLGHNINFVQDNHSKSTIGVLRGLHYQAPPSCPGKACASSGW